MRLFKSIATKIKSVSFENVVYQTWGTIGICWVALFIAIQLAGLWQSISYARTLHTWSDSFIYLYGSLTLFTNGAPIGLRIIFLSFFYFPTLYFILLVIFPRLRTTKIAAQMLVQIYFPLLGLCLGTFIFSAYTNTFIHQILVTASIAIIASLPHLYQRRTSVIFSIARYIGLTTVVTLAAYVVVLMLFFVPLFLSYIASFLLLIFYEPTPLYALDLISILWMLSSFFTFIIIVSTPFVAAWLYLRDLKELRSRLLMRYTSSSVQKLTAVTVAAYICISITLVIRSQAFLPSELDSFLSSTSEGYDVQAGKASRLIQDPHVRSNLIATYLSSYRYLGDSKSQFFGDVYKSTTQMDHRVVEYLSNIFRTVAQPFFYIGTFEQEIVHAKDAYLAVFGAHIQKAETETLASLISQNGGVGSIFSPARNFQTKATVLDSARPKVHLVKRSVTGKQISGVPYVQVQIIEEYENMTTELQEVYQEFSLPADSVITDLKLGPDLSSTPIFAQNARFQVAQKNSLSSAPVASAQAAPQIAAKGAVAQTFDSQYTFRRDPAMIEQVGPRQYRLRVYPIPVKNREDDDWDKRQPNNDQFSRKNQKVSYTYIAPVAQDGTVELPRYSHIRNLFRDEKSQTTHDVALTGFNPLATTSYSTVLNGVSYMYSCYTHVVPASYHPPRLALFTDTSYPARSSETIGAGDQLLATQSAYFPAKKAVKFNGAIDFGESKSSVYFGPSDISQVTSMMGDHASSYDGIVVIAGNSLELYNVRKTSKSPLPIYVIYPKRTPPAYTDDVSRLILSSGGGIYDTFDELAHDLYAKQSNANLLFDNGRCAWTQGGSAGLTQLPLELLPLLQKHLIMRDLHVVNLDDKRLDALNLQAQTASIVTPYSSMIVLVTNEQRALLKRLEGSSDRYTYESTSSEELLRDPSTGGALSQVSAVPEPHEWALLFVGLCMLFYAWKTKGSTLSLYQS